MAMTLKLAQQLQNLDMTHGYVEFYTLDLNRIGGSVYRFTPNGAPAGFVVWQGQQYFSLPIMTQGWDISGDGSPPRPTLALSNVGHVVLAQVATLGDLVGATLTRHRTFERFIDGAPEADSNAFLPPDIFVIEQLVEHSPTSMSWQLASVIDRLGMKLPRRQVLKDNGFPGVGRYRQ